ncbi:hypothetical protein SAMN04488047_11645 [Tranquillimonas alkanivorans]|uniref:Uncharacterized protein n=1 Tax=Tranquillimonas alkanivorans TaxID=441119 RepID=A0A1I5U154_9RHOB|nr:hypothetical protein SAMN04488047_11645 [Tranquillimonas alkanivorans]
MARPEAADVGGGLSAPRSAAPSPPEDISRPKMEWTV